MILLRIVILMLLLAGGLPPATVVAAPGDRECGPPGWGGGKHGRRWCDEECAPKGERRPFGDYRCNKRSGWYGARREVASADQARAILVDYFADRPVTIGPLTERPMFFMAEIRDAAGKLVDRVIVHKRSGRIRSIY